MLLSARAGRTYSHEQMLIKILAFAILLAFVLNSASFIQVDALEKHRAVSERSQRMRPWERRLAQSTHIPFFLVLIFVLNNKSTLAIYKHSHPNSVSASYQ